MMDAAATPRGVTVLCPSHLVLCCAQRASFLATVFFVFPFFPPVSPNTPSLLLPSHPDTLVEALTVFFFIRHISLSSTPFSFSCWSCHAPCGICLLSSFPASYSVCFHDSPHSLFLLFLVNHPLWGAYYQVHELHTLR